MAKAAYQGHVSYSSAKESAVTAADNVLAPADRATYDPTAYASEPGAAARANGYPRSDGKPGK